jgi:hypothetical protein
VLYDGSVYIAGYRVGTSAVKPARGAKGPPTAAADSTMSTLTFSPPGKIF